MAAALVVKEAQLRAYSIELEKRVEMLTADLMHSEERFRLVTEASPNAIVMAGRDGKISFVNRTAVSLFGYSREEMLGNPIELLIPTRFSANHAALRESFYAEPSSRPMGVGRDLLARRKDGSEVPVEIGLSPVQTQEDLFTIATITDITERKAAETRLARQADELAVLYENTRDLVNLQDLDKLLRLIVERAVRLLQTPSGTIGLYDQGRGEIELVTSVGSALAVGSRIAMDEGAMGVVAQTLQPLVLENYTVWENRLPGTAGIPVNALMAAPMLYSGELVGVLCVFEVGNAMRKFNQEDEHLLSLFAAQAASAVHNAQLFEETRQHANRLSLLYDASLTLNSFLEPAAQMEYMLKICIELMHSDRAEFYRYDVRTRSLTLDVGIAGADKSVITKNVTFNLSDGGNPITRAAQYHIPIRINYILDAQEFKESPLDFASGLWMPVLHEKQVLGVLSVTCDQPCQFTDQDERMLGLFSNQLAISLETARLFEETNLRMQRLQALRAIDIAISGSFDIRIVLDLVLEQIVNQLKVDAADVLLYNAGLNQLEFAAGRGFRTTFLKYTYLRPGEGYAGKAIEDLRTIYIENLREASNKLKHSPNFDDEAFITYFAAPLVSKGQVKGVLELFHRSTIQPEEEWLGFLEALAGQVGIAVDSSLLFTEQQRSAMRISMAYDATIEGWSRALDFRDQDTEGHTQRVTQTTLRLAREMGISESDLIHIRRGALLHDIGKMGVPDRILLKPGPLDVDEWEIMRRHPEAAYELLLPIDFLRPALDIPYCHHEKWDGSGYPRGLKGDAIPLAARIFAIVDVWDALNSDRPYRKALPREESIRYIEEQSSKHFDPKVVDIFLRFLGK